MPNRDYHADRRQYDFAKLEHADLHLDPFQQFSEWMDFAQERTVQDPTAMSLSTVDATGQPHSRIVLLKAIDDKGFVFYTHYISDKGQQIDYSPKGALLFFWPELDRQVRIEGLLEKTPRDVSERYFQSRPRDSQIAALISQQSQVVPGRKTLEQNMEIAAEEQLGEITCPEHWGGYRLVPDYFEFWQGRPSRLHDRFRFTLSPRNDQAWRIDRLSP